MIGVLYVATIWPTKIVFSTMTTPRDKSAECFTVDATEWKASWPTPPDDLVSPTFTYT